MKCFPPHITHIYPIPVQTAPTPPHSLRSVEVQGLFNTEVNRHQERTKDLYQQTQYEYHGHYNDQYYSY